MLSDKYEEQRKSGQHARREQSLCSVTVGYVTAPDIRVTDHNTHFIVSANTEAVNFTVKGIL